MANVLLSTAYFPPVSWMREALKANTVFIETLETYPKQTYRNRCRIAGANGVLSLSIPVKKVFGKGTKTRDIEISYDENWQRIHRRSIQDAYTNSPFYQYFRDELEEFFTRKYKFLIDYNQEILLSICQILERDVNICYTEKFEQKPMDVADLRYSISPKLAVKGEEFTRYQQVFEERYGFQPDLSVLDLLFNQGPAAIDYFE